MVIRTYSSSRAYSGQAAIFILSRLEVRRCVNPRCLGRRLVPLRKENGCMYYCIPCHTNVQALIHCLDCGQQLTLDAHREYARKLTRQVEQLQMERSSIKGVAEAVLLADITDQLGDSIPVADATLAKEGDLQNEDHHDRETTTVLQNEEIVNDSRTNSEEEDEIEYIPFLWMKLPMTKAKTKGSHPSMEEEYRQALSRHPELSNMI